MHSPLMLFQNIVFIAHMAATSLQPNPPGPVYYIYLTIHTFKWSEVSVSVYITSAPWLSASVIIQWAAAVEWTIPKDITKFS